MLGFWLNAVTALMYALMYAIEMGIINERKPAKSRVGEGRKSASAAGSSEGAGRCRKMAA